MISRETTKVLCCERVKQKLKESHYQNQNRAEIIVKLVKDLILRLLRQYYTPPKY